MRLLSLGFARDQVTRAADDAEEMLDILAHEQPTGDPWTDEQERARWESLVDDALDQYNAALRRLGWEMREAGLTFQRPALTSHAAV